MKQFYYVQTTGVKDNIVKVDFVRPVRKICIVSSGKIPIRLSFASGRIDSFFLYKETPVYLDFQSANNGSGIPFLEILDIGFAETICISVSEYGTGGNIEWYK